MATVVGTTTIPIMAALAVAVGCFLLWAVAAVRAERAERTASARRATTVRVAAHPTPVQVVVGRHYTVAEPDQAAVLEAMSHRVRPPTPFPTPFPMPARPTPAHEEPAAAMPLSRSA